MLSIAVCLGMLTGMIQNQWWATEVHGFTKQYVKRKKKGQESGPSPTRKEEVDMAVSSYILVSKIWFGIAYRGFRTYKQ